MMDAAGEPHGDWVKLTSSSQRQTNQVWREIGSGVFAFFGFHRDSESGQAAPCTRIRIIRLIL